MALTQIRIDVARELHPPRVHAGTPSRVDVRVLNEGTRRSPLLSLHDAVSGTRGARLLVGPLVARRVGPRRLPPADRAARRAHGRARSTSSSPIRSASPACR